MAASVVLDSKTVMGNQRVRVFSLTLDNSYPTGGYAISTDQLDLPNGIVRYLNASVPGYSANWNYSTGKLQLFRQTAATSALIEVANAVDVSAVAGSKIFVFGH
jgi:hypothetical protein